MVYAEVFWCGRNCSLYRKFTQLSFATYVWSMYTWVSPGLLNDIVSDFFVIHLYAYCFRCIPTNKCECPSIKSNDSVTDRSIESKSVRFHEHFMVLELTRWVLHPCMCIYFGLVTCNGNASWLQSAEASIIPPVDVSVPFSSSLLGSAWVANLLTEKRIILWIWVFFVGFFNFPFVFFLQYSSNSWVCPWTNEPTCHMSYIWCVILSIQFGFFPGKYPQSRMIFWFVFIQCAHALRLTKWSQWSFRISLRLALRNWMIS